VHVVKFSVYEADEFAPMLPVELLEQRQIRTHNQPPQVRLDYE
jgi:hypothetical protein